MTAYGGNISLSASLLLVMLISFIISNVKLSDGSSTGLVTMSEEANNGDALPYRDPPMLFGRHLLVCRSVWYDAKRPDDGFGLAGLFTRISPPQDVPFPYRIDRLFVYAQIWGDEGEYRFRIRLAKIESDEDDEVEIQLGPNGEPREFAIPTKRQVEISRLEFVQQIAFPIGPVYFPSSGLYEFQLWADGIDEPIVSERIDLTE